MIRKILYIFTFIALFFSNAFSEIVKEFKIVGNERVSKSTIVNFSEVVINKDLKPTDFNKVLKNLYSTTFFENVSLNLENGILTINVKEYPIVQSITFNGIKAKKFKKELYEKISLKEKNPYNKFLLKNDLNHIKNLFKRSGYYFVEISLDEKINDNNTVDLIYNIDIGKKSINSKD